MANIISYLHATLVNGTEKSKLKIKLAAWVCLFGHPVYWFIWTYIFPQPYESAYLRFISAFLAIGLIMRDKWRPSLKKYFPLYWHLFLLFILPVTFTFLALKNNFNYVWILCHLGMVFLMILIILEIVWFWVLLILGTAIAVAMFYLDGGAISTVSINPEYIPILLFALLFCIAFMYTAMLDIRNSERKISLIKTEMLKSLAGNVAHEVRTPVISAHLSMKTIKKGMDAIVSFISVGQLDKALEKCKTTDRIVESTNEGLVRGKAMINLILRNIREEMIDRTGFKNCSIADVVRKAMNEYPFKDGDDKRVRYNLDGGFVFHGDEDTLIFTLFNLIKNALYYLPNEPDKAISIKLVPGDDFNSLYFKDNGAGIDKSYLPKIFDNFTSYNNVGGTGLGLPFCKRAMKSMDGDIICHSIKGEGTEFVLVFPVVSEDTV